MNPLKIFFLILSIVIFYAGCHKKNGFEDHLNSATSAYLRADKNEALSALRAFINYAHYHETEAHNENINYNLTMGLAWAQLAVIYASDNNSKSGKYAIDKAIIYFDLINEKSPSELYIKNKYQAIWDMIVKTDLHAKPKWQINEYISQHCPFAPTEKHLDPNCYVTN